MDTPARQVERRQRRERDPDQLRWIAQARTLVAALDAEAALGLSCDGFHRRTGTLHLRTQLKAATQKTGTHTQAGLLSLVAHRSSA